MGVHLGAVRSELERRVQVTARNWQPDDGSGAAQPGCRAPAGPTSPEHGRNLRRGLHLVVQDVTTGPRFDSRVFHRERG